MKYHRFAAWLFAASITSQPIMAQTMTASPNAPTIGSFDIANLTATNGTEKWWPENSAAGAVKGQTFTTGTTPVALKSITYRTSSSAQPTKTYVVRLGTVAGTAFTQIHSETFTQSFVWNANEYMTWTFAAPIMLSANTTYAIDVGITASTTAWQTGIPYAYRTANNYPGGVRYSSGTNGAGTNTLNLVGASDMLFHLALEHPQNPSPESGSIVDGGDVTLQWTNLAPTSGNDVLVDVWFGTDPGNLTQVVSGELNLTTTTVNAPAANTYYWRIDTYLDGDPESTPATGDLFNFIVDDTDGDGIPDSWEIQYFGGPTAADASADPDGDGLTNLQEFQLGLNPLSPDTDNDGLLDGDSIIVTSDDPRYDDWVTAGIYATQGTGERTFRGENEMGTDPLNPDTDGDGLLDGVETNTGIWVSSTNTGTDPLNWDTDRDGLSDGRELTVYGTDPHNSDTDGDGVGDWYELYSSFTDPLDGNDKPILPYPLPAHDGSPGVSNKPVKVYIMSGQSNMVGEGTVTGDVDRSLETMTRRLNRFTNLIDSGGNFIARQDVRYRGVVTAVGDGALVPGIGGNTNFFGPEVGFGQVMGWYHEEPVLLIKSSQGNRALGWDILPPGGERYAFGDRTYPAYGEAPESWLTASGFETPGGWYAGKQYDDFFLKESDMGMRSWVSGTAYPINCQVKHNGVAYISKSAHTAGDASEPGVGENWSTFWNTYNITNVVDVLDGFATQYPQWAEQGFEIAGFVWWQGDRDRNNMAHATRYEQNLVRLITTLRDYYDNRYPGKVAPDAPFVLATLGQTPLDSTNAGEKALLDAKLAVDGDAGIYPQFAGNVRTVYAHPLSEGGASNSHYNQRAGTYMLVGDALGRAMVELLENTTPPVSGSYTDWANAIAGLTDKDPQSDFDGGGLATALEWVLGGDPTDASDDAGIMPTLDTTSDPDGKLLFTFRRRAEARQDEGTTAVVHFGSDLEGWNVAQHQGSGPAQITITEQIDGFAAGIDRVTVAIPQNQANQGRLFARLNVSVGEVSPD